MDSANSVQKPEWRIATFASLKITPPLVPWYSPAPLLTTSFYALAKVRFHYKVDCGSTKCITQQRRRRLSFFLVSTKKLSLSFHRRTTWIILPHFFLSLQLQREKHSSNFIHPNRSSPGTTSWNFQVLETICGICDDPNSQLHSNSPWPALRLLTDPLKLMNWYLSTRHFALLQMNMNS